MASPAAWLSHEAGSAGIRTGFGNAAPHRRQPPGPGCSHPLPLLQRLDAVLFLAGSAGGRCVRTRMRCVSSRGCGGSDEAWSSSALLMVSTAAFTWSGLHVRPKRELRKGVLRLDGRRGRGTVCGCIRGLQGRAARATSRLLRGAPEVAEHNAAVGGLRASLRIPQRLGAPCRPASRAHVAPVTPVRRIQAKCSRSRCSPQLCRQTRRLSGFPARTHSARRGRRCSRPNSPRTFSTSSLAIATAPSAAHVSS